MAEVVAGVRVFRVADEFGEKDIGVEEVDAHGDVDHLGIKGGAEVGGLGLLDEAGDFAVFRNLNDAEVGDLAGG